jgi:hypothetical protein
MPLSDAELPDVQRRVMAMLADTIQTFDLIEQHADTLYGDGAHDIRAALKEFLDDFWRNTRASGERHPEALIYETPRQNFQWAGLYGAQLAVKEKHVSRANATLRARLTGGIGGLWRRPFRKWVDVINNFLGSLASATGLGEALKELKDCLRDELPDDDE